MGQPAKAHKNYNPPHAQCKTNHERQKTHDSSRETFAAQIRSIVSRPLHAHHQHLLHSPSLRPPSSTPLPSPSHPSLPPSSTPPQWSLPRTCRCWHHSLRSIVQWPGPRKTDVNPSDIGTKALGRERFYRLRSMLGMGTAERDEFASRTYGESDESNDRHM